jgi:hypothetical protein
MLKSDSIYKQTSVLEIFQRVLRKASLKFVVPLWLLT